MPQDREKNPKLQKNQKELLEEWKDGSARFDKSLRKQKKSSRSKQPSEEKLVQLLSILAEYFWEQVFLFLLLTFR